MGELPVRSVEGGCGGGVARIAVPASAGGPAHTRRSAHLSGPALELRGGQILQDVTGWQRAASGAQNRPTLLEQAQVETRLEALGRDWVGSNMLLINLTNEIGGRGSGFVLQPGRKPGGWDASARHPHATVKWG